ncbi:MAG: flavin reductase family protein [Variovorax sp.]
MFVETSDPAYRTSIFNSLVAPRPIGWVSSCSPTGQINLAPFSYFNGISATPPMLMFACNAPADRNEKDTLANVRATGEFCVNIVSYALREQMNITSSTVPHGDDEFELAGLEKGDCKFVKCPRVLAAPASMECQLIQIVDVAPTRDGERTSSVVLGRVLAMHVRDDLLDDAGRFDPVRAQSMARLGGFNYLRVTEMFAIKRPDPKGE